ncbi:MAG: hypothetical protein Q7W02_12990 [Candidatus Rokubacteria bacterium]|nr:hypothetical protein [Candidatus Rokubacteria bacterium]
MTENGLHVIYAHRQRRHGMETSRLDTPVPGAAPRWQLTAPESYVLLNGPRASGVEAFKKGLLELVARGVRIKDLPKSARDRGMPVKGYTRGVVVPALMERGLYRREEYRVLGLFPITRYVETATGAAARAELEALMKTVDRDFGASVERDPRQALALVGMLGSAVVLMNPFFPDLERLSQVLRKGMGNKSPSGGFELYVSNLDLDSFDFDVGALDSLDGHSMPSAIWAMATAMVATAAEAATEPLGTIGPQCDDAKSST